MKIQTRNKNATDWFVPNSLAYRQNHSGLRVIQATASSLCAGFANRHVGLANTVTTSLILAVRS
ncbi:MAG TPA: hypothetical protein VLX91_06830 [Candidatus Acidoferrales bacterium]|nr:hypothetical protein [Candidatus Acidoferrales bacterium]